MLQKNQAKNYLIPILLIIILVVAAGLRFYNLNWDGGIFAHPDERSTVAYYAPTIKWPDHLADRRSARQHAGLNLRFTMPVLLSDRGKPVGVESCGRVLRQVSCVPSA